MLFAIYCLDKPDSVALRLEIRPAHLKYGTETIEIIRTAGPLLANDNETMIGSLVIVECDTIEDAEAWSDSDPYVKAGLYQSRDIRPFYWLVGNPND